MPYWVLFDSDLPEMATRDFVRMLESLPLSVIPACTPSPERDERSRCSTVPLVTLGTCPTRLPALRAVGPRGWIAILPEREGSADRFLEAGAFEVLRMPVERGKLLSVVSRCLSVGGAAEAPVRKSNPALAAEEPISCWLSRTTQRVRSRANCGPLPQSENLRHA